MGSGQGKFVYVFIFLILWKKNTNISDFFLPLFLSYLGFDHTATLFHIRDSPVDPVDRPIFLTNAFSFSIRIHDVSLPEEATTMFKVEYCRRSYCDVAFTV